MSEIEKDRGSDSRIDGADIFLELAKPELYRMNAFRVAELPVESTVRDLGKRRQIMEMASKTGMPIPAGSGRFLPLKGTISPDIVQEAMQHFQDPERRLVDEFFWFWPKEFGQSKSDKALAALSRGDIKEATEIWLNQEQSDNGNVPIHNLAVLYHAMALDIEYERLSKSSEEDSSEEEQRQKSDLYWQQAFQIWGMLLEKESFWSKLAERIRSINDPRLTTGTARRMQTSLPLVLLIINARLALQYAEQGNIPEAARHKALMEHSGFEQNIIDMALRRVIEPIRERIKLQCRKTETEGKADPIQAGNIAQQLIDQTKPLLAVLDCLLPGGNPIRDGIHDEIALCAVACQIQFGNKTENWKLSSEILKLSRSLAVSEAVKIRINENAKIVQENADLGNTWCDEGYYDLPPLVLTVLERAREQAKAGQWNKIIPVLEKMIKDKGEPRVEEKDKHLIYGPLAYCLNLRAMTKYNPAVNQHNAPPYILNQIAQRLQDKGVLEPTKCMACGGYLFEGKPLTYNNVSYVVCIHCWDKLNREQEEKKDKLRLELKIAAEDLIFASELNPRNNLIKKNLTEVKRVAADLGVRKDLPTPMLMRTEGGLATIPELVSAIKGKDSRIRRAAKLALKKIDPTLACQIGLKQHIKLITRQVKFLFSSGIAQAAIFIIIMVLGVNFLSYYKNQKTPEFYYRLYKYRVISKSKAISVLAMKTLYGDPSVKKAALKALKNIDQGKAMSMLVIKALESRNPILRKAAQRALKNIDPNWAKSRVVISTLMTALLNQELYIRKSAAQALGNIGPEAREAIPSLISAMKNSSYSMREELVKALAKIEPGVKNIPTFTLALKDKSSHVRKAAAKALGNIKPEADEAIPVLVEALKDENLGVRIAVMQALGNMGSVAKEAIPALIPLLGDTSFIVQKAAKEVLNNIDPECLKSYEMSKVNEETLNGKYASVKTEDQKTSLKKNRETIKGEKKFKEDLKIMKGIGNPLVTIETSLGNITLELFQKEAPITVKKNLEYIKDKFYDKTIFHRVVSNFVIQGGGFTINMKKKPTRSSIKNEATNKIANAMGTIAIARKRDINSATSQFFINLKDNFFLDHKNKSQKGYGYCVFGKVIEGMEVVHKIGKVKTKIKRSMKDVPVTPVVVKSVQVRLMKPNETREILSELLAALKKWDFNVREASVQTLGEMGPKL